MAVDNPKWKQIRANILTRDGWTCHYCAAPATEVDHIVPRIHGGTEDEDNLVAACTRCNRSKGRNPLPKRFSGVAVPHPPAGSRLSPMRRFGPAGA